MAVTSRHHQNNIRDLRSQYWDDLLHVPAEFQLEDLLFSVSSSLSSEPSVPSAESGNSSTYDQQLHCANRAEQLMINPFMTLWNIIMSGPVWSLSAEAYSGCILYRETSCMHCSDVILANFSTKTVFKSWRFCVDLLCTLIFMHRFSFEVKSVDWLSHSNSFILFLWNKLRISLAVCLGSLGLIHEIFVRLWVDLHINTSLQKLCSGFMNVP